MLFLKHSVFCCLLLFVCVQTQAEERLEYAQFKIYADTANLTFEELIVLEEKGEIKFGDYDGLSSSVLIYWIKIDSSVLKSAEYLFFSNFFDRIEAYSVENAQPFSINGRLVDFKDRSYKEGFYRHVIKLNQSNESVYFKLISETGNSIFNRSLSHIEISSAEELGHQSNNIHSAFTLLTGMELIILMINLFLIYLKPDKAGYSYAFFILIGILMSNLNAQTFVDKIDLSAITINNLEQIIGVLIVYSFNLFTAYFLNAFRSSRNLHYILVFPIFPIIISSIFITNGYYFPLLSISYFLISLLIIIYLLKITWKYNSRKCIIFLLANGLSILAALVMVLALRGFLVHHFLTTNFVFLGFILRDSLFTLDLIRNYFQLQKESIRRDVTIEKLKEEKEQLKRIETLKTTFFNNVSHELRTPLTLILSPLESSLKSDKIPEELKKELNLSLKNGKYLLQLVNEMLDLSKLDKGELDLIRQPTDVVEIITNIRDTFQPYAKEKGQTIYISHADDNITANIDLDKFEKIIINLISNAIKYSDKPGSIYIKVFEKKGGLNIQITDESRGISAQDLPFIFDRYYQSEENKLEEGTGIGLSIVKEFVEMHKGSVSCKSELSKGSIFILQFPNAIQKSEAVEFIEKEKLVHDQTKSTLLIVEDHHDMRAYLKDNLAEFNTIEVGNGEEAIEKLKNGLLPDLILTDYMMPKMDGYELAKEIKKEPNWVNIPIIFLTARTLTADKVKILNMGVDDYIVKPFDLDELRVRIEHCLETVLSRKEAVKINLPDLSVDNQQSFKADLDNYILDNLANTHLSNTDLAYQFNISERNLFRRVKIVTGQPPASYIREIRLQKARMILESSSENSISEVAYECGIDNLAHFSQAFKKRFGKLPSSLKV